MPDGLKKMIFRTYYYPSTKADAGHDEDISPDEILKRISYKDEWTMLSQYAFHLLKRKAIAAKRIDPRYKI
jgi:phosphoribosylaminoimidazole-succinocarboxamide synthase